MSAESIWNGLSADEKSTLLRFMETGPDNISGAREMPELIEPVDYFGFWYRVTALGHKVGEYGRAQ